MTDNTRAPAEQALKKCEHRLRSMFETAADAILTFDGTGIIERCNPAAERMFGYSAAEVTGERISLLFCLPGGADQKGVLPGPCHRSNPAASGITDDSLGCRKDGSTFPAELAISKLDGLDLSTAIIRDVSERRRYEALMADVAIAEQVRIGRDLHDTVGQDLAALALSAERAGRRLEGQPGAEVLAELASGIRSALSGVRAAARGLTRVANDAQSLFVALTELTALVNANHGIACRLETDAPGSVPDEVAEHLYRIASEAVANAVQHAEPKHVHVRLARDEGRLTLCVADDGVGIAQPSTRRGIGTWIMRSRAAAIDAELEIRAGESCGTVVTCRLRGDNHGTAQRSRGETGPDRR